MGVCVYVETVLIILCSISVAFATCQYLHQCYSLLAHQIQFISIFYIILYSFYILQINLIKCADVFH